MKFVCGCSERRFFNRKIAAIILIILLLLMKLLLLLLLLFVLLLLLLYTFIVHSSHGRRKLNITFLVQLIFELEEVWEDLVE